MAGAATQITLQRLNRLWYGIPGIIIFLTYSPITLIDFAYSDDFLFLVFSPGSTFAPSIPQFIPMFCLRGNCLLGFTGYITGLIASTISELSFLRLMAVLFLSASSILLARTLHVGGCSKPQSTLVAVAVLSLAPFQPHLFWASTAPFITLGIAVHFLAQLILFGEMRSAKEYLRLSIARLSVFLALFIISFQLYQVFFCLWAIPLIGVLLFSRMPLNIRMNYLIRIVIFNAAAMGATFILHMIIIRPISKRIFPDYFVNVFQKTPYDAKLDISSLIEHLAFVPKSFERAWHLPDITMSLWYSTALWGFAVCLALSFLLSRAHQPRESQGPLTKRTIGIWAAIFATGVIVALLPTIFATYAFVGYRIIHALAAIIAMTLIRILFMTSNTSHVYLRYSSYAIITVYILSSILFAVRNTTGQAIASKFELSVIRTALFSHDQPIRRVHLVQGNPQQSAIGVATQGEFNLLTSQWPPIVAPMVNVAAQTDPGRRGDVSTYNTATLEGYGPNIGIAVSTSADRAVLSRLSGDALVIDMARMQTALGRSTTLLPSPASITDFQISRRPNHLKPNRAIASSAQAGFPVHAIADGSPSPWGSDERPQDRYAAAQFDRPARVGEIAIQLFSPSNRAHLADIRIFAAADESALQSLGTVHFLRGRLKSPAGDAAFHDVITMPPLRDGEVATIEIERSPGAPAAKVWGIACLSQSRNDRCNHLGGSSMYLRELFFYE